MKKITLKKYHAAAIDRLKTMLHDYAQQLNDIIIHRQNQSDIFYSELMQLEICLLLIKKIEQKQLYVSKNYTIKLTIQESVCLVQAAIFSEKNDQSQYALHIAEKTQTTINQQLINI
jgi:hypothetical protein